MTDSPQAYSLSPEEWEQWMRWKNDAAALLAESEERKRTLLNLQTATAALRVKYERAQREQAKTILELNQTVNDRTAIARRNAAGLVVVLKALDELLKALTASNMEDAQRFFPGEVFRAMQEAREVIRAHGIPF